MLNLLAFNEDHDLNELQEFGFEPYRTEYEELETGEILAWVLNEGQVKCSFSSVSYNGNTFWEYTGNSNMVVYNLIQAGLIKKI